MKTITILILLISTSLYSVDYYVNGNTGNDSNSGSLNSQWRTLSMAGATATAGDTVFIQTAVYNNDRLEVLNSGLPGSYITFQAQAGHAPVLEGKGVLIIKKSYIIIDGLTIHNIGSDDVAKDKGAGISIRAGFIPKDRSLNQINPISNIIIRNCSTSNTYGSGILALGHIKHNDLTFQQDVAIVEDALTDVSIIGNTVDNACNGGGNECISVGGGVDGFEIAYNTVINSTNGRHGGEGIDCKAGVRNGTVHHNQLSNIQRISLYVEPFSDYTENIEIYNNRVHDSKGGFVITSENGGDIKNIKFYNNILDNIERTGILIYNRNGPREHEDGSWSFLDGLFEEIFIYHNTVYNCGIEPGHGGGGIRVNSFSNFGADMFVYNNISYNNDGFDFLFDASSEDHTEWGHNEDRSPGFIDPTNDNFLIFADSTAVDGALENISSEFGVTSPSFDFNDKNRSYNAGFDIGAHEYTVEGSSNLLYGSSFEVIEELGHWNYYGANLNSQLDGNSKDGDHCWRIWTSIHGNPAVYQNVNGPEIIGNSSYTLTGWVKVGSSTTTGAKIGAKCYSDGKLVRTYWSDLITNTTSYENHSVNFTTPAGIDNIQVVLKIHNGVGGAWFDQISLSR